MASDAGSSGGAGDRKSTRRGRPVRKPVELLSESLSLDFQQQLDFQKELMKTVVGSSSSPLPTAGTDSTPSEETPPTTERADVVTDGDGSAAQVAQLREALQKVEAERDELKKQIENQKHEGSDDDKKKIAELSEVVEKEKSERKTVEGEVAKLKEEQKRIQELLKDANARADDTERERDDFAARERTLQTQIQTNDSMKRSKEREIQNLKDDLDTANQKYNQLEEELKRSQDKVKQLNSATENSADDKEKKINELEDALNSLRRELTASKDLAAATTKKLNESEQTITTEQEKSKSLQKRLEDVQTALEKEKTKHKSEVENLEQQVQQLRNSGSKTSQDQTSKLSNLEQTFAKEKSSLQSEIDSLKKQLASTPASAPASAPSALVADDQAVEKIQREFQIERESLNKQINDLRIQLASVTRELEFVRKESSRASNPPAANTQAAPATEVGSSSRSAWGRKAPASEQPPPTIIETTPAEEDGPPPPPPKRGAPSPTPKTPEPSLFSFFNKLTSSSERQTSTILSAPLTSSASDTPLRSESPAPPSTPGEGSPVQGLLSAANEAVAAIIVHINSGSSDEEKATLVDDSKDSRIASLVRGKLSSSLVAIFNNEFNPFTIWGTPHVWDFIQAATSEVPSVANLAGLSLNKAVRDISKLTNDNNVRFRSLVVAGLNNNALHEWIFILGAERSVGKYYEKTGFLANQDAVKDLTFSLKPLAYHNFTMDVSFELTPREKPTGAPKPIEPVCSSTRSGSTGEKQPIYHCQTCQLTTEDTAFCGGCLLSKHSGHVVTLSNYANFVCKTSNQ